MGPIIALVVVDASLFLFENRTAAGHPIPDGGDGPQDERKSSYRDNFLSDGQCALVADPNASFNRGFALQCGRSLFDAFTATSAMINALVHRPAAAGLQVADLVPAVDARSPRSLTVQVANSGCGPLFSEGEQLRFGGRKWRWRSPRSSVEDLRGCGFLL